MGAMKLLSDSGEYNAWPRIPGPHVLPDRDGWLLPQILFHEPFCDVLERVWWQRLQAEPRSEFLATLRFGLLNLPGAEANQIQQDGMTVLIAMVGLCNRLNPYLAESTCAQSL